MFESGSRGSYSFRSGSSKTRDSAKGGHSLTRSSVGHSVTGSIVAGNDLEPKVVLKSRSNASDAVPGQRPSEALVSAGVPVQNRRNLSVALHSNGASHLTGTDTTKETAERNKTSRSYSSPLVWTTTQDSFNDVEQPKPQCNSYHDTTTEGCTKSLPTATYRQLLQESTPNNRKCSAPDDTDSMRSSGHGSAENWSASDGGEQIVVEADRYSRKSHEDNDATEINNNDINALKGNLVAASLSPDNQSLAKEQAEDDHRPSIDGFALAAGDNNDDDDDDVIPLNEEDSESTMHRSTDEFARHSSDHATQRSDDHFADHLPDNSDDHFADHSRDNSDDHFADHSPDNSDDHFADHFADHLHDQLANQINDHSVVHLTDHSDDHPTDYFTDHSTDHLCDPSVNYSANHIDDHSADQLGDHLADQTDDPSVNFSSGQIEKNLSQLQIDSGATCEPETSAKGPTIIRTFEPPGADATAAEPEHPYFARIAAEAAEPTPILSHRGTVRGVKNRVKSGVASFLDKQDAKKTVNYAQLERGKVVFYTTSVTVVRGTFEKCLQVKRILQTQMVDFEERDVFVSKDTHQQLIERLQQQPEVAPEVPQVFVDGYHLGDVEEIERLNESGILRKIFYNFKKVLQPKCCTRCGGYRYLPCTLCHGSKKTRRNCFTNEFSALRCTSCDDNGLVKCELCNVTDDSDQPVIASTSL